MPLIRKSTQLVFHRTLYAGQLQSITLLKRDDDQNEKTVRAITLFDCRRSRITKTGEPIQGDMSSDHRTIWHIPRIELNRVGVAHINAIDRIVDHTAPENTPRTWQPESTTNIEVKLFETMISVMCLRVDSTPPGG